MTSMNGIIVMKGKGKAVSVLN